MITDFVRNNGYMSLGTRLKRLGERLQADVGDVSAELGMPTAAGLLTALGAIEANGQLTINGLASALGVSQPAATKLAARLVASNLITMSPDPDDRRTSRLAATDAGLALVAEGRAALWPAVEAAVRGLCEEASGSLIDQLDAIEAGLSARSLSDRIRQRLHHGGTDDDRG